MRPPPVFLSVDDVTAIHRRMISEFGGAPGLRDAGLLESAVAMPAARFGGRFLHGSLPAMAAAYLFHLCRSHAFVDGNKRTALAAAEAFILLNGCRLSVGNDELVELVLAVARGERTKDEVVSFFKGRTRGTRGDR